MTKKKYSAFHRLNQKIAASKAGSWFYAHTLHHFDALFLKLSKGRNTMSSLVSGLPVVVLTTTGAKSGLPRTTPLLGIRDEQNPAVLAVIASNWGQK